MKFVTILIASLLLLVCCLLPAPNVRRVAAAAHEPDPFTPRLNPAFASSPFALPDINAPNGIKIAGHSAPWGGLITLAASDAFLVSGGTCAFNISYDLKNSGMAPTAPPFKNRLRRDSTVVSIQSNLSLAAGETRTIATQAYLTSGDHILGLFMDNDFVVAESNEGNNVRRIKIKVNCP